MHSQMRSQCVPNAFPLRFQSVPNVRKKWNAEARGTECLKKKPHSKVSEWKSIFKAHPSCSRAKTPKSVFKKEGGVSHVSFCLTTYFQLQSKMYIVGHVFPPLWVYAAVPNWKLQLKLDKIFFHFNTFIFIKVNFMASKSVSAKRRKLLPKTVCISCIWFNIPICNALNSRA